MPFRLPLAKLRLACFYSCVVDGVLAALPDARSDADPPGSAHAQLVTFHSAQFSEAVIAQVQANARKLLLRTFMARGHLESHDAKPKLRSPAHYMVTPTSLAAPLPLLPGRGFVCGSPLWRRVVRVA